jgi:hypothetical protein
MTEAAKEAVKIEARGLRDGYGGSADDTYFMTFSVQRADDRTPGGILAWIQTETFALRGSYNSLSKTEQQARIEWERVHRSEAPWWQTQEQPAGAAPTPTSSSLPIENAHPPPPASRKRSEPPSVDEAASSVAMQIATPVSLQAQAGCKSEKGSFLVTAVTETSEPGVNLPLSKREVKALQACATVCENATLDCFRVRVASARIWWYTGFEEDGVPAFTHDPPQEDLHIPSIDQVTSIVAEAVRTGKNLKLVVLNTCRSLELGRSLCETARVPFVVCWDGFMEDRAAFKFGMALATAVQAGQAPRDAFRSACSKVESMSSKKRPGVAFKLQKVVDPVAGRAVHERESIVPVGLPVLLTPPPAVATEPAPPPPSASALLEFADLIAGMH